MNIQPARQQDLPEIMAVQRAAFEAEAQLVNDWNIPPLTQTLDELADDWRKGIMLMAVNEDGKIVGTVRGHKAPDGFYIGRLAVLPQWQGRGMGSALLEAIIDLAQTTPRQQSRFKPAPTVLCFLPAQRVNVICGCTNGLALSLSKIAQPQRVCL